ncbi:MAG: glycosyltransferase [Bacteroidota bacterium]|nr:glycosyltransferase [Bacteroidota bacterium]
MDITVIIPAYNRIWSLPKAIESCKNAGGLSVQIIVVDDGSTDGTWEMLQQTPGIEIYRQQHWGKPWAVNMAFAKAKGKYIKFLDSDDWLIAGSLLKEFDLAELQNADLVVAGYEIYEGEKPIRTQEWTDCDDFIAQNLGECDSSHYSAFLFKKEFINDIPHRTSFASANFASRDDRCFMLEVGLKEPKVVVLNEAALCHAHHDKGRLQFQKSTASACTNYQHLLIYKNIIKQLADTNRLTQRRIRASINILWPLCHWMAKDNINEAAELLKWIRELQPGFQIPEKGITGLMYKSFGFKGAERIMSIRRLFKYGWS